MAYDITVILDDLPGTLAQVGEALGNAGVNIGGYCSFTSGVKTHLHVMVEDVEADPPPRYGGGRGGSPERAQRERP